MARISGFKRNHSSYTAIKIIALITDWSNALLQNIAIFHPSQALAISNFVIHGIVYLFFCAIYAVTIAKSELTHRVSETQRSQLVLEVKVALFTFIGGLFYYIGDNLMEFTIALDQYTDSIDILKLSFLVVAFFFLQLAQGKLDKKPHTVKFEQSPGDEKESQGKKVPDSKNTIYQKLLFLLTYTLELDIVISIIFQSCTDISEACSTSVTVLTWILFSGLITAYIIATTWSLLSLYIRQACENKLQVQLKYVIFIAFLTICKLIPAVGFLLADNNLPLASAFADAEKSAIARLTLLSVSFASSSVSFPIFPILFALFERKQNKRREQMDSGPEELASHPKTSPPISSSQKHSSSKHN